MVSRVWPAALLPALVATALPAAVQAAPWQLPRSDVLTIAAPDGHSYRVLVAWPEGEPPAAGWPVLWVLDGEDNFALATQFARRLARGPGRRPAAPGVRGAVGPGVIVAIDSGPLARRILDYTPAVPGYVIAPGMLAHGREIGGADAFLAFLEQQVRPRIAARWRIDTRRETLAGHSFGGLLALHDLRRFGHFDAYAAISPSLWYGDGRAVPPAAAVAGPATTRVLIVSGGLEGGPAGTSAAPGAAREALAAALQRQGLAARYVSLPGQTHGTTMLAAMADIVRLAFARESAP